MNVLEQQVSKNADDIDSLSKEIVDLKANGTSQTPLFVDSIGECTDTTKVYVLPDGYIYGYICTETVSGGYTNLAEPLPDNTTDTTKWVNGYRFSSSGAPSAESGTTVSNMITCKSGDVIRIKGVTLRENKDRIAVHCTANGFNIIGIRCDANEENDETLNAERVVGTITEQSFGVFTVTSDTIYETKIGAGDDRVISY